MLLPGALALGGGAAIAAVPIIRALGPSARPPDPATIVALAAAGFFLPSALLSAVTPLVVKVQLGTLDETGRVVGRLSALGTAGSLVGVFATGFVLVAEFATTPVVDRARCPSSSSPVSPCGSTSAGAVPAGIVAAGVVLGRRGVRRGRRRGAAV